MSSCVGPVVASCCLSVDLLTLWSHPWSRPPDVVRQMVSEMSGLGFDSPFKKGPATESDHNLAVLAAVICAGLYPGIAR